MPAPEEARPGGIQISIESTRVTGKRLEPDAHRAYIAPSRTTSPDLGMTAGTARPEGAFSMAWVYLLTAGILEIVWATAMKQSDGFTRPGATAVTLVAMIVSFWLLAVAMRSLPLGTAYTIWTGIGAVGAFLVGIIALGEAVTPLRILAATLIVSGLVLMKLATDA